MTWNGRTCDGQTEFGSVIRYCINLGVREVLTFSFL